MRFDTPFAPGLHAGGQPTPDDLARLAADGVRTVINLRAPSEPIDFDEAREARRLGLRYVTVPVAGPHDVTPDTVARFSRELDQARSHGAVLLHCASGNRVGALVALDQALTRGQPADAALAIGRSAGLTSLEPLVTTLLGQRAHA